MTINESPFARRLREIVGFHCQQTVEKYMKALLTFYQVEVAALPSRGRASFHRDPAGHIPVAPFFVPIPLFVDALKKQVPELFVEYRPKK